jgi:hypothetical protein
MLFDLVDGESFVGILIEHFFDEIPETSLGLIEV